MATFMTPRKVYSSSNICCLCGFSFTVKEIDKDGTVTIKKLSKLKLRLNDDKREAIHEVTDIPENADGVCTKCFAKVEKVVKYRKEISSIISQFQENMKRHLSKTPGSKKKRLLRSPKTSLPEAKSVHLSNDGVKNFETQRDVSTCHFRAVLSKLETSSQSQDNISFWEFPDIVEIQGEGPQCTGVLADKGLNTAKGFSARRCLGLNKVTESENTDKNSSKYIGEVKLSVHYPSGEKTAFVRDEVMKQICRAVYRNQNVINCILEIISKSDPASIATAASKLINRECEGLCKRGSNSILQNTSYAGLFDFTWDQFHKEIQINAPNTLKIISATVCNPTVTPTPKKQLCILHTFASGVHGRFQEMSNLHYQIGLILAHGGCTVRDIDRLAKLGWCMSSRSIFKKLSSWETFLDSEILDLKKNWSEGGEQKYQLIGDNWDKNIIPSYHTSQSKTISLHLFNVIAVVDRVIPSTSFKEEEVTQMSTVNFIPSLGDQALLLEELTFLMATSVIQNLDQMHGIFDHIYPKHFKHRYSDFSGIKTQQYSIGLFDCNENKTQDVIQLLKGLTEKYVPMKDGEIAEEVFFGGDRLTDERIQGAQNAMSNAGSAKESLKGFISKIEDWHRMLNFLEAMAKLTYSSSSQTDRGTLYYFRNLLNARNVKHDVKNSFRAYKMLYYSVFDAICCTMFLKEFGKCEFDSKIDLPEGFEDESDDNKIMWINDSCQKIVKKWFFDDKDDIFQEMRVILEDPNHPENYWLDTDNQGHFKCHFCENSYAFVGSLKAHESIKHQHVVSTEKKKSASAPCKDKDELFDYIVLVFKLTALLKNLDTAIDMADGARSVRSAKYELPIFNKTNKHKYVIGCVQLIDMSENPCTLTSQQRERLIANRTINMQGGKNNNVALDEYLEMINRDSKNIVSGHQTKENIIERSKQFPHLINYVKYFDVISEIKGRKGFHKLPNYKVDVSKIAKELFEIRCLEYLPNRKLHCRNLSVDKDPYSNSVKGLSIMIHRHKPSTPFSRLRNRKH